MIPDTGLQNETGFTMGLHNRLTICHYSCTVATFEARYLGVNALRVHDTSQLTLPLDETCINYTCTYIQQYNSKRGIFNSLAICIFTSKFSKQYENLHSFRRVVNAFTPSPVWVIRLLFPISIFSREISPRPLKFFWQCILQDPLSDFWSYLTVETLI